MANSGWLMIFCHPDVGPGRRWDDKTEHHKSLTNGDLSIYRAVQPPSTVSMEPTMYVAASLARKMAAP